MMDWSLQSHCEAGGGGTGGGGGDHPSSLRPFPPPILHWRPEEGFARGGMMVGRVKASKGRECENVGEFHLREEEATPPVCDNLLL